MQLKAWFGTAFVLAFLAGGGACLVAERLAGPPEAPETVGSADAYVTAFDARIGVSGEDQRRALLAAYDQYLTEVRGLTQRLLAENRDDFHELERQFTERVLQQLGPEQRRRWRELTGTHGEAGPADTDRGQEPGSGDGGDGASEPADGEEK